jgi:conserved oligomeric Golgi complex subunit 1
MASDVPDPQKLKSWEEAFQYPISSVRRVEQQLRQDIASNKDKLRALVG